MNKELKPLAIGLASHCGEQLGFERPPKLFLKQDEENSSKMLGKTAHYDPDRESVTIYITGRHPKDVLRSLAHELVHHHQNLRGDLSPEKCGEISKNYAQDNEHMRNMEKEAYLVGNILFRDWEDSHINIHLKESKNMYKLSKLEKEVLAKVSRKFLTEETEKEKKARKKSGDKAAAPAGELADQFMKGKIPGAEKEAGADLEDRMDLDAEFRSDSAAASPRQGRSSRPVKREAKFDGLDRGVYEELFKRVARRILKEQGFGSKNEEGKGMTKEKCEGKTGHKWVQMQNGRAGDFYCKPPKKTKKPAVNHVEKSDAETPKKNIKEATLEGPDQGAHPCYVHIKIKESGEEGKVIPGAHTLFEDGTITHYDVEFSDRIEENIPINELAPILVEKHSDCPVCPDTMIGEDEGYGRDDDEIKNEGVDHSIGLEKTRRLLAGEKLVRRVIPKLEEGSGIITPEQEETLYQNRFGPRNAKLFDKLTKSWTK